MASFVSPRAGSAPQPDVSIELRGETRAFADAPALIQRELEKACAGLAQRQLQGAAPLFSWLATPNSAGYLPVTVIYSAVDLLCDVAARWVVAPDRLTHTSQQVSETRDNLAMACLGQAVADKTTLFISPQLPPAAQAFAAPLTRCSRALDLLERQVRIALDFERVAPEARVQPMLQREAAVIVTPSWASLPARPEPRSAAAGAPVAQAQAPVDAFSRVASVRATANALSEQEGVPMMSYHLERVDAGAREFFKHVEGVAFRADKYGYPKSVTLPNTGGVEMGERVTIELGAAAQSGLHPWRIVKSNGVIPGAFGHKFPGYSERYEN